ncbi:flagellar protein FliS [Paucidesulfovibrio gracilis DSM 16080]|uniref:Flagellar protein FliS n=1 Tax=Paucidesulfovibrio gracilis DSM 16080 TaxID=1121449 RepID=A0A1T4WC60_9BACT|nr:flagellar export chaperone FliS [Paucidesulfovibrio gracilis]SKA74886.1 flagellar protein FliS [Paucidesulfovibrio gracilis DSM 16080]
MSKAAHAYLATQVTTTTQGQLLIMLYDAAIKFLKQAKERIEAKDYAKKGILISRAMDIISELANSLNRDKGGKLANNLDSLYMFCNIRLAKANLKMDTRMIDEVLNILENIRSAYAQIVPETEKQLSGQARTGLNRAAALGAAAAKKGQETTTATESNPTPPTAAQGAKAVPASQSATPSSAPAQPSPTPPTQPQASKQPQEQHASAAAQQPAPAAKQQPAAPQQQTADEEQPKQPPKPSLSKSVNLLRQRAASAYSNSL